MSESLPASESDSRLAREEDAARRASRQIRRVLECTVLVTEHG